MKPSDKLIIICLSMIILITLSGFSGKEKANSIVDYIPIDVGGGYRSRAYNSYLLEYFFFKRNTPFVFMSMAAEEPPEEFKAEPNALGTPDGFPEWIATPANTDIEYIDFEPPDNPGDSDRLARIDYSLRIISGAVILAADGFFIWLTIYKPLKSFIGF